MFPMIAADFEATVLLNATVSGSGGSSAFIDLSKYVGPVLLLIDDRAGGTAAATVAVTENVDGVASPSTPQSGAVCDVNATAYTIPNLSTAASHLQCYLRPELMKRYARVDIAGTSISHNVVVIAVGKKRYV